ncbi:MAG: polyprenol monophosphomannose synthase [Actinomycetaceae bacterium]|nr:polyprenol monophosphomannose synthase [Actinomycetaceae bacterium]
MKTLVVIPTYNELESLPSIVARVRKAAPECDVLIVDDNSPDGTGDLADSFAREDEQIHVLHREGKEGLGRAYLHAFSWAMENGEYTHFVQMDADGSHRPEQLPALLDRAGRGDVPDLVIGSRYVRGGETVGWSRSRELLSRGGNAYIRLWLGLPVSDATAGFRVYRVDFLRTLDLESVESAGYFFQTDMTYRVHNAGGLIVEVPISFAEREAGTSKLSGNIFTESLARTTRMGLAHRTTQLQKLLKK